MVRFLSFVSFFVVISLASVMGQDYDNGEYLVSKGPIPSEFIKLSSEKFKEEVTKIDKKEKSKIKRTQKDFYLETSFETDEILASGKILFNDPLSIYVNKVADIVLAKNKKLRDSLRFYVTRSTAVNAFCYPNGMICINIGLLSHLKNEAELAM
ncbi:MAG: hypothetical protein K2Q22_03295, partial [Cytophagales bacterium]|nr:hypothetical protein [Cytophagales bacterium]